MGQVVEEDAAVVHRTARVGLRVTAGQADRLYGLLRAAGDVWAALVDLNSDRRQRQAPPEVHFQALCRQLTGIELGGLSRKCAEGVLRRYTDAWHETVRRKRRGEPARYPRRKRRLFPVRWRHGGFSVTGARRVRLAVARGAPPLQVRLAGPLPFPAEQIRSVTLVADDGRLWLDVTARVAVSDHDVDPARVAGVDIGLIHPYAVAGPDGQGLVVSGRAVRAEARMHLEDSKRRSQRAARRAPRPGQRASRRWRQHRRRERRVESKHRRRVRQAHHEAARQVVAWPWPTASAPSSSATWEPSLTRQGARAPLADAPMASRASADRAARQSSSSRDRGRRGRRARNLLDVPVVRAATQTSRPHVCVSCLRLDRAP